MESRCIQAFGVPKLWIQIPPRCCHPAGAACPPTSRGVTRSSTNSHLHSEKNFLAHGVRAGIWTASSEQLGLIIVSSINYFAMVLNRCSELETHTKDISTQN